MRRFGLIAILLLAFFLRTWQLTSAPPGLTHDEANHGREGISILDGDLRLYYPLNYGSEPLYSYLVAGSMAAVGENLFALRLVGVYFGMLTLAISYRFATTVFGDWRLGLLMIGFIGVSYWALVTSRMALRATLLPFFITTAAYCFWRLWDARKAGRPWLVWFLGFAVFLSGTFYIYLASRVLWLIFPLFLAYLFLTDRREAGRLGWLIASAFALFGVLISPMFIYLQYFPESETRLQMLDGTLNQALTGNLWPVMNNSLRALGALVISGQGDQFLAYNIPGRPVFDIFTAVLAIIGFIACFVYWKRPQYAFVLLWFGVGMIPSLITGPTANTTRNVGALTMIYLLPALGVWLIAQQINREQQKRLYAGTAVWLVITAILTSRAYFFRWAQDPDVRAAYQTTIMAAVTDADTTLERAEPVVISSVYPGAAHDTSITQVILENKERDTRWVDGRRALLIPSKSNTTPIIFAASSADLHLQFKEWVTLAEQTDMRADDLDPFYTRYQLTAAVNDQAPIAQFNDGLLLLEAKWLGESVPPNGVAEMMTVWRVLDPTKVGPVVWPIETTDVVLFTQVLSPEGTVLTQEDRLDAPSWSWQKNDVVIQIHQVYVGGDTAVGEYETIVGVYDRQSGVRLNVTETGESFARVQALQVRQ